MSPTEHVCDALDQRVPVPANIWQLCTTTEEESTNIPQATIKTLTNCDVLFTSLHEVNGGFLTPPPSQKNRTTAHFKVAFIVGSLRLACVIIMLSEQYLNMPKLRGGWIILALTQIYRNIWNNIWEQWALCVHRKSLRSLNMVKSIQYKRRHSR